MGVRQCVCRVGLAVPDRQLVVYVNVSVKMFDSAAGTVPVK